MNYKLIKCVSILLIFILLIGIINVFMGKDVKAAEQNTKVYTKGSNILDKYEGYSELLDNLLEKHPKWTFTILFTGLDWDTVIKNETISAHGRNLVQGETGAWVCSVCGDEPYDNSSWRCASAATVEYYMDPRNALYDETYLFQFENLKWVDNTYTIEGIEFILDGCDYLLKDKITYKKTDGKTGTINKTYSQVIMEAAKKAGISPYHLASRIRQEQGTGSQASPSATGNYSGYIGYYNFFNVGATGSGSSSIIKNALIYAKQQKWNDPVKAIEGGAQFLVEEYIQYGQSTLYLQKFDVDDSDGDLYWHQYQQNVAAAKTESIGIMKSYKEIDENLNMPFNFVIPVFEDMPDTKCPIPGTQSIVTQNIEVTDASIIVYKSKDKKSTQLATLKKGEKLLRIEIDSNKTNGYLWSKVVLADGRKGYIISSGVKKIADITNCNISAVAVEPGNVRNGPGTSGTKILITLTEGQRVTIIEKGKYKNIDGYDWSRIVLADGTQGYIVARYVEEVKDDGTTESGQDIVKVVCNGGLSLRKEPGTSSELLGYIDKGEYLTRTEKAVANKNGYVWDKVVTGKGTTGYVARGDDDEDYIQVVDSTNITGSGFETIGTNLMCEPDITAQNVISKASGVVVKNASGTKVTTGNIGTGYTVTYKGKTYTVVKLGDVNGDGKITSADLLTMQRHLIGSSKITNTAKKSASDINGDKKITSADLLAIKRHLLKILNIAI